MKETLDNTDQQEDNTKGQAGNSQDTQESQTGFGIIEQGVESGNSFQDPVRNCGEHRENSGQNRIGNKKTSFKI